MYRYNRKQTILSYALCLNIVAGVCVRLNHVGPARQLCGEDATGAGSAVQAQEAQSQPQQVPYQPWTKYL